MNKISYYIQKGQDTTVTYIGKENMLSHNKFKKLILPFIDDCESLVERINNKDFRITNIRKIIHFYNSQCE